MTDDQDRAFGRALLTGEIPDPSDPRIAVMQESIGNKLRNSTAFRQYISHLERGQSGVDNPNTLPWQAEGERQYVAFLLARAGSMPEIQVVSAFGDDSPSQAAIGLAGAVAALEASVYLWAAEIEALADAAPLPKHTVSPSVMSQQVMFWSRSVSRFCSDGVSQGTNNWTMVQRINGGIRVYSDFVSPRNEVSIHVQEIPAGIIYPDHFSPNQLQGAGVVLSRLAFLNSTYVSPEAGRLPRQWRREALRTPLTATLADPTINVVKLRRDARENVDREKAAGPRPVDWKHQWWVSGHYRAQWYPSEEAHKVIWIAPYLKGPDDKPVVPRIYKVTR